ncbi:MAG TPA: hypothetical protein VFL96_05980 [Acidobacteriaceae bacterium]|nr:hypothetical protein [Acidobacteriaceae bacterium]
MSNPVPQCTHVKTNGEVCGSPAVSGTELCYHHSKVKSALGKWTPASEAAYGEFTPIPFIFPEDRASLQIDYFLLFQATNEQRVERRAADLMFRMLREMGRNLGKSGSLVEDSGSARPAGASQSASQGSGEPTSQKRDEPTSQKREVGHPQPSSEKISVQASASAEVFPAPIAPESCFSTQPPPRSLTDVRRELFRTSSFHPAGQRTLNRYFAPLPER